MATLTVDPIGTIATPFDDRYDAPRQPGAAARSSEGIITLRSGFNFEHALEDLEGFERIWVIYWFDRNSGWKPKVLPPRGSRMRRGVFATRSPHRPNPLGLSLLRLIEVRGRTLRVGDVDLLDGTPILDIKPYLPYAEAHPDARIGWLEGAASEPVFEVRWSTRAARQARWLADDFAIDITHHVETILAGDPAPHPYRRTTQRADGTTELAVKSWRVVYRIESQVVEVLHIESGYEHAVVATSAPETLHDHAAHVAFHARWTLR